MSEPGTGDTPGMAASTVSESLRQKELEVAREIAQAFLMATKPVEVYLLALARVTPLVGASFGSVFLRDEADPDLLKLACAQNWPQIAARFLGQMRIRVGRGPRSEERRVGKECRSRGEAEQEKRKNGSMAK